MTWAWLKSPSALPPPLWGRAGAGGRADLKTWSHQRAASFPCVSRTYRRLGRVASPSGARTRGANLEGMARPPTLTRPHKGGGDAASPALSAQRLRRRSETREQRARGLVTGVLRNEPAFEGGFEDRLPELSCFRN